MKRQYLLAAALVLFAWGPASAAELTPERKALIMRMIETSGEMATSRGMRPMLEEQYVSMFAASQLRNEPRAMEIIREEAKSLADKTIEGTLATIIRSYAEMFSDAEIVEMTAFNLTPLGQKIAEKRPAFTLKLMENGRTESAKYVTDAMVQLFGRLNREGFMEPKRAVPAK